MVLLIAILFWLLPISAHATIYYVATTGSNSNSGTDIDTPFLTIDKCAQLLVAGDTCLVRGGTYSESGGVRIRWSGTAAAPIRLAAYPGELPVINFPAQTSSNRILIQHNTGANVAMGYITVEGFEITGGWEGVRFSCLHNSIIRNNKIHDGYNSGIFGVGGHHNLFEGNIIYHQGNWVGCANGTQSCNQQHGMYMHGDSYTIRKNIIYDNIGGGIQQNGSDTSFYTTARHPSAEFSGAQNWIIADNTFAYQANASGLIVWGSEASNVRVENNIFYENRVNGTSSQAIFFTGNTMSGVSIKNNHSYASGGGGTEFIGALSTSPVTEGVQYTQSGNVVNVSAPAFVNGGSNSLPASPDFRLTASSPVNIALANEFPNNSTNVVGAFKTIGAPVCSITTNVATCVFPMSTAVPINVPSTTGWSVTCTANPTACPGSPTISSVTRHTGTDRQVDITISGIAGNACATGQDWKISYNSATGSATGNDDIGAYPGLHQKLFSSTNTLATNACTGSGPSVYPAGYHFYYKFDDGSGTNANDESANNLDCTLINSATWVSGKNGTAMGVAQGTQQACTVNWGSGVNPTTQSITAVIPIYIEVGTENATHYIGGPDLGTNQRAYVCGYLGSWRISLQTTTCQSTSASNLTVVAGWNFLVLRFDSGTDVATLSKDGTTGTGGATGAYSSFTFASNWKFGRLHTNNATGTYRFDEVAVYLSLEDPAALYAAFQQDASASGDTFSQTAVQFEEIYTSGVSGTVRVLPSPSNTKKVVKGGAVALAFQVECNNCAATSFRLTARDNGTGEWLQVANTETASNVYMWGTSTPQFLNNAILGTRILANGCTVVDGSTQATADQIPTLTLPASGCTMMRHLIRVRSGASGYTEFRLENEGGVAFTGSYVLGRIDIADTSAGMGQ